MIRASNSHITKVNLWGMPFHGLVRYILRITQDSWISLPSSTLAADTSAPADYLPASSFALGTVAHTKDGTQVGVENFPGDGKRFALAWELFDPGDPRAAGTSRLFKNPALPEISRDTEQASEDAELGHIWRNYALFSGARAQIARNPVKRLGGLNWVYLASDGSRWQVAITVPDSGANPIVLRYAFKRFGQFGNAEAETMSSPVNFLSLSKGSPALPLSLAIGGVSATGDKVLLNTHGGNPFLELPYLESFTFNQDVINYGALVFVHRLDVTESISSGIVTGVTVAAVELKNRAQCRPGVVVVSSPSTITWTDAGGATHELPIARAYKKLWILGAYFVGESVEYITFEYLDSVTGTAHKEVDLTGSITGSDCHTHIIEGGESWGENRTFERRLTIFFGAAEYVYSSQWHRQEEASYGSGGPGLLLSSVDQHRTWTNETPFSGPFTDESTVSSSGTQSLCESPVIPDYDVSPGVVSNIPEDFEYQGITFYRKSVSSPASINPIMPLPFVSGEGIWGIIEISKNSSGQYQYQYRMLSAYGTKHLLSDAAVTINTAAPINFRIPLFASAHPITGDYIYAQETPVCYV